MTVVITHRGLEPGSSSGFAESSPEAFCSQLDRGFGLEFDPCFLMDGEIVITHAAKDDAGAEFTGLTRPEVERGFGEKPKLFFLDELLARIESAPAPLHAVHFKGKFQDQRCLSLFERHFAPWTRLHNKLLIFDLKPSAAEFIRERFPQMLLAPSAADPFDIERYNSCVAQTLLTIEQIAEQRRLYDWVWLDEWDLAGPSGTAKTFYNREVFSRFRSLGLKIALVTPELHATSPGLLGGESHPDAATKDRLFARCREICALKPDAVCTDYPEEVRRLAAGAAIA